MKNKNEKGFALVLSLTLLLVMSLLGGSLIVITSGDHQSNNTSDEYQQSFYVAETALLEAEKYLLNQMMGPWVEPNDANVPLQANADAAEHATYIKTLEDNQGQKIACLEEIAFKNNFISKRKFNEVINNMPNCNYKDYLKNVK